MIRRSRSGWQICERVPPTRAGKRVRRWFPTLMDAARFLEGAEAESKPEDLGPTIKSFSEIFLRRHPPAVRDPLTYKSNVSLLFAGLGGETKLGSITPGMIEDFRIARVTNDHVKPYSVTRQTACLSAMFSCAAKWGDWKGPNPVRGTEIPPEPPPRDRVFSDSEVAALLKAASSDPMIHALIACALYTGLRRGSLLTLQHDDLRDGFAAIRMENIKGGRGLRVPIHEDLKSILNALPRQGPWVFHRNGALLTADQIRFAWSRVCKCARVIGRFHDLRRTFGTTAMERGVGIGIIQRLLGHRQASTTAGYLHAGDRALVETLPFLGPRRSAAPPDGDGHGDHDEQEVSSPDPKQSDSDGRAWGRSSSVVRTRREMWVARPEGLEPPTTGFEVAV